MGKLSNILTLIGAGSKLPGIGKVTLLKPATREARYGDNLPKINLSDFTPVSDLPTYALINKLFYPQPPVVDARDLISYSHAMFNPDGLNSADLKEFKFHSAGLLDGILGRIASPLPAERRYQRPGVSLNEYCLPVAPATAITCESAFEAWYMSHFKLAYYQGIRKGLQWDIAYTKNEYLLSSSSDIIREKLKKLEAVEQVIDLFKLTDAAPESHHLRMAAAEAACHITLESGRLLLQLGSPYNYESPREMKLASLRPLVRFLTVNLSRGRTTRWLFIQQPLLDKRRSFRNLVRTLFKQMDDQSGHDEFLALYQSVFASTHSLTLKRSLHGPKIYSWAA